MRYSIVLSYAGAGFCGWQRQPSDPSVQECLEDTLGKLLGGEVPVIGAGRMDTGVNAIGYVACFDGPEGLAADDFRYKLNAILPRSVVVSQVVPVAPDFHARFDAVRREYTYFIHREKDPFVEAFSWQCGYPGLDFEAMNAAAGMLVGTHDFSCFEKVGADNKTSVCTVFEAYWKPYVPTHASVMQGLQPPESFLPSPEKGSGRKAPVGIHNAHAHDVSLPARCGRLPGAAARESCVRETISTPFSPRHSTGSRPFIISSSLISGLYLQQNLWRLWSLGPGSARRRVRCLRRCIYIRRFRPYRLRP